MSEGGEKRIPEEEEDVDLREMQLDEIAIDAEIDEDFLMGGDLGERGASDLVPEEIVLSSDEEPDTSAEISVVLLKRPPITEPQEAFDILDSDEECPLFVTEGSKPENVNIIEKKGVLAEYIEREGLGMIYAE